MEQYISKSALVAEIEKWRDRITKGIFSIPLTGHDRACATFEYEILGNVKDFIDTFETKNVDLEHLEQEVEDFCYEYDDRKEKWYELCPHDRKLLYNPTWANFAMSIAKHFFELGLKASQKREEAVNSPEENPNIVYNDNIVYKDIVLIDSDGNRIKARIEQREKI